MDREREHDDLIDLGVASVETKGVSAGTDDHFAGLIKKEGLSND